jgi:dUTP pyrophosphatase
MIPIKVNIKTDKGTVPSYQSEGAAGMDICANSETEIVIAPGSRAIVPTGIYLEIPEGFEAQVRPRSGLALKHGVTVLNTPGTIDSDYRGEVKVILINLGQNDFSIKRGDRIAQLVFAQVTRVELFVKESLDATSRGPGGFGSTGT